MPSTPPPVSSDEALARLDRLAGVLPGWMFVLVGISVIGAVLVTPSWLNVRDLVWQRDVMRAQAERLREQRDAYQRFDQALLEDDPNLIERLAFTELRLMPAQKQAIAVDHPQLLDTDPLAPWLHAVSDAGRPAPLPPLLGARAAPGSVEHWLYRPMPAVGVDLPRPEPITTRLIRLTSGPKRLGLLLGALCCLLGGLWWAAGGQDRSV